MKIIVCGAGEIGRQICRDLSVENCDLTVIDRDASLLRMITDRLGASGIAGDAGDPEVLQRAGVKDAGIIIAATPSDHVNIVICLVARSLGSDAWTMARLENNRFLTAVGNTDKQNGPVDEAISPERELAKYVVQLLETSLLFDKRIILEDKSGHNSDEKAYLFGIHVNESCTLLDSPLELLSKLFEDLNAVVVGFRRNSKLLIAGAKDQIKIDDEVFICCSHHDLNRTASLFGKDTRRCRRVVLAGAGRVGMEVARQMDVAKSGFTLRVIERDRKRAEEVAESLARTVVLNGNAMTRDVLEEAGIANSDAIVSVTQDDRTNLLVASQAKKLEDSLVAVSLVNDQFLMPLANQLEIDTVVDPRGTIMSSILSRCRGRGIDGVGFIGDREAEIIEAQIKPSSRLAGERIRKGGFPENVLVGAVKKNGKIVKTNPDTRLEAGDRVAFFSLAMDVPELLNLLDSDVASS